MSETREKIKDIKDKLKSFMGDETKRSAYLKRIQKNQLHEQEVLNLSFNKDYGVLEVVLMAQCLEDGTYKALQCDKQGRLILSPQK